MMNREIDELRKQLMTCNNPAKQVALLNKIKQLEKAQSQGVAPERRNPSGLASA